MKTSIKLPEKSLTIQRELLLNGHFKRSSATGNGNAKFPFPLRKTGEADIEIALSKASTEYVRLPVENTNVRSDATDR